MNHLTHKTYQRARDLILASEGRTIEQEIFYDGCKILCNKNEKFLNTTGVFGLGTMLERQCFFEFGKRVDGNFVKSNPDIFEILGRPISLNRVLMALGQRKYVCEVSKEYKSVDFYNYYDEDEDLPSFNLGQPLHLQPLETIEKIVEILKTNQK